MDLSICIVNYKADKELERCLESIKKHTRKVKHEVIVVDNSEKNRWYSGGNNLAWKKSRGRYILILNPDCYLKNNTFKKMVSWMDDHPKVGVVEPLQLYDDGSTAPTGSLLNRWYLDLIELTGLSFFFGNVEKPGMKKLAAIKNFRQEELDRKDTWQTEVVSGAAMMVRREVLDQIGGFDEGLKLYYTDTDLCRRILKAKWQIWHHGKTEVWHSMGRSTRQLLWKKLYSIYARDAREYYRKNGETAGAWLLFLAMKTNQQFLQLFKRDS